MSRLPARLYCLLVLVSPIGLTARADSDTFSLEERAAVLEKLAKLSSEAG